MHALRCPSPRRGLFTRVVLRDVAGAPLFDRAQPHVPSAQVEKGADIGLWVATEILVQSGELVEGPLRDALSEGFDEVEQPVETVRARVSGLLSKQHQLLHDRIADRIDDIHHGANFEPMTDLSS